MTTRKSIVIVVGAVIVAAAAWQNYSALSEAFGAGPPYYGRTTNMDKWGSPWPLVVAVDCASVLVIALLARFAGAWPWPRSSASAPQ